MAWQVARSEGMRVASEHWAEVKHLHQVHQDLQVRDPLQHNLQLYIRKLTHADAAVYCLSLIAPSLLPVSDSNLAASVSVQLHVYACGSECHVGRRGNKMNI